MRTVKFHEDRKQEILSTAKRLFLVHGFEHTTISLLVHEIGVAHGLFYYYFKSKDEVVEAVLESILFEFSSDLNEKLKNSDDDLYGKFIILINGIFDIYHYDEANPKPENWIRIYYHDQIVQVLSDVSKNLLMEGIEKGFINIPNAEVVLNIVIGGSMLLIERESIRREKLISVIFQMIGLTETNIPFP